MKLTSFGLAESREIARFRSRGVTSSLVLAVALTFAFALHAAATMKMAPYVQAVATDSIYVLVECDSTSAVTVQYGLTNAYGSTRTTESYKATSGAVPATYVHRVKLTGLDPNTQYHYRATQGGVTYSTDAAFYTACLPGTPFRFAAYADTRTNTTPHNTIAGRIKNANPRFTLMAGDTCNDSSYLAFKNEWFLSNELLLQAVAPTYDAPGNHEGWSQNTQAFFQSPASASGVQDYYSFDYGDVHVVSINNQVNYAVNSPQWSFVRDDLASTKPWKIVMYHYPAYCSGGHGEEATMISWSQNLFVPKGVDLVLTGHSHFYQHNLVNGINHLVIGTAGAPFYDPTSASYTLLSSRKYHYAIIDVTPTTLHMEVRDDSGTGAGALIDTLDLVKTVAAAKSKPDTTVVDVMGTSVVTLVPTEAKVFYAQDLDANAGIRVETNGTRPALGAKVLVRGTLGTKPNGERVLLNATVATRDTGTGKARALPNKSVGGLGYVGSEDRGLVNQGLLMRVWGKVTKVTNPGTAGAIVWLDDGSGVDSGESDGARGIKVIESGLSPTVGAFLAIGGVVASEKVGSKMIRVIRYKETLPS